ncbi:MAG: hypothetical protein OEV94_07960 [Deltaproteobacteria bacterium]|nr:hypothetical protein [Deltaproteobacteria bacterium]
METPIQPPEPQVPKKPGNPLKKRVLAKLKKYHYPIQLLLVVGMIVSPVTLFFTNITFRNNVYDYSFAVSSVLAFLSVLIAVFSKGKGDNQTLSIPGMWSLGIIILSIAFGGAQEYKKKMDAMQMEVYQKQRDSKIDTGLSKIITDGMRTNQTAQQMKEQIQNLLNEQLIQEQQRQNMLKDLLAASREETTRAVDARIAQSEAVLTERFNALLDQQLKEKLDRQTLAVRQGLQQDIQANNEALSGAVAQKMSDVGPEGLLARMRAGMKDLLDKMAQELGAKMDSYNNQARQTAERVNSLETKVNANAPKPAGP